MGLAARTSDIGGDAADLPEPFAADADASGRWCVDDSHGIAVMSSAELRQAGAAGKLTRDTKVWRDGRACWLELRYVPELEIPGIHRGAAGQSMRVLDGDDDSTAEATPEPSRIRRRKPVAGTPSWRDDRDTAGSRHVRDRGARWFRQIRRSGWLLYSIVLVAALVLGFSVTAALLPSSAPPARVGVGLMTAAERAIQGSLAQSTPAANGRLARHSDGRHWLEGSAAEPR